MCLCAFLYFTEFFPLNINYFCNQKKHTVIKSIKKKSFPSNFSGVFATLLQTDSLTIVCKRSQQCMDTPRLCDAGHGILKTTELPKISINCKDPQTSFHSNPTGAWLCTSDSRAWGWQKGRHRQSGVTKGPRRLAARQWGQASQGLRRPVAL